MLQLNVLLSEDFDEETNCFVASTWPLQLEHSLVSLSKWESKYEKPFLTDEAKTHNEVLDYIQLMDLGTDTPPEVFQNISQEQYNQINTHINAKMTATWFNRKNPSKSNNQKVTSELIYYWITSYEIPWIVETWHLNRLFTLIEVFNEERNAAQNNKSDQRMSSSQIDERRALNEARKKAMGTTG